MAKFQLDELGPWSQIKLEIVEKYAAAYSTVVKKSKWIKRHIYIDALSGPGIALSKKTGDIIPGSPMKILRVKPAFSEYHFIDLDGEKTDSLKSQTRGRSNVTVHTGDCNEVLLETVFPRCRYADYHRALCLLDPYALTISWEVLQRAAEMGSIEVFYNFMIMDANMNVLLRDPDRAAPSQLERMDKVWPSRKAWREKAYRTSPGLFANLDEKASNDAFMDGFREVLREVAGFKFVPKPLPLHLPTGPTLYYLFFASCNSTGAKIAEDIFEKYRGTA